MAGVVLDKDYKHEFSAAWAWIQDNSQKAQVLAALIANGDPVLPLPGMDRSDFDVMTRGIFGQPDAVSNFLFLVNSNNYTRTDYQDKKDDFSNYCYNFLQGVLTLPSETFPVAFVDQDKINAASPQCLLAFSLQVTKLAMEAQRQIAAGADRDDVKRKLQARIDQLESILDTSDPRPITADNIALKSPAEIEARLMLIDKAINNEVVATDARYWFGNKDLLRIEQARLQLWQAQGELYRLETMTPTQRAVHDAALGATPHADLLRVARNEVDYWQEVLDPKQAAELLKSGTIIPADKIALLKAVIKNVTPDSAWPDYSPPVAFDQAAGIERVFFPDEATAWNNFVLAANAEVDKIRVDAADLSIELPVDMLKDVGDPDRINDIQSQVKDDIAAIFSTPLHPSGTYSVGDLYYYLVTNDPSDPDEPDYPQHLKEFRNICKQQLSQDLSDVGITTLGIVKDIPRLQNLDSDNYSVQSTMAYMLAVKQLTEKAKRELAEIDEYRYVVFGGKERYRAQVRDRLIADINQAGEEILTAKDPALEADRLRTTPLSEKTILKASDDRMDARIAYLDQEIDDLKDIIGIAPPTPEQAGALAELELEKFRIELWKLEHELWKLQNPADPANQPRIDALLGTGAVTPPGEIEAKKKQITDLKTILPDAAPWDYIAPPDRKQKTGKHFAAKSPGNKPKETSLWYENPYEHGQHANWLQQMLEAIDRNLTSFMGQMLFQIILRAIAPFKALFKSIYYTVKGVALKTLVPVTYVAALAATIGEIFVLMPLTFLAKGVSLGLLPPGEWKPGKWPEFVWLPGTAARFLIGTAATKFDEWGDDSLKLGREYDGALSLVYSPVAGVYDGILWGANAAGARFAGFMGLSRLEAFCNANKDTLGTKVAYNFNIFERLKDFENTLPFHVIDLVPPGFTEPFKIVYHGVTEFMGHGLTANFYAARYGVSFIGASIFGRTAAGDAFREDLRAKMVDHGVDAASALTLRTQERFGNYFKKCAASLFRMFLLPNDARGGARKDVEDSISFWSGAMPNWMDEKNNFSVWFFRHGARYLPSNSPTLRKMVQDTEDWLKERRANPKGKGHFWSDLVFRSQRGIPSTLVVTAAVALPLGTVSLVVNGLAAAWRNRSNIVKALGSPVTAIVFVIRAFLAAIAYPFSRLYAWATRKPAVPSAPPPSRRAPPPVPPPSRRAPPPAPPADVIPRPAAIARGIDSNLYDAVISIINAGGARATTVKVHLGAILTNPGINRTNINTEIVRVIFGGIDPRVAPTVPPRPAGLRLPAGSGAGAGAGAGAPASTPAGAGAGAPASTPAAKPAGFRTMASFFSKRGGGAAAAPATSSVEFGAGGDGTPGATPGTPGATPGTPGAAPGAPPPAGRSSVEVGESPETAPPPKPAAGFLGSGFYVLDSFSSAVSSAASSVAATLRGSASATSAKRVEPAAAAEAGTPQTKLLTDFGVNLKVFNDLSSDVQEKVLEALNEWADEEAGSTRDKEDLVAVLKMYSPSAVNLFNQAASVLSVPPSVPTSTGAAVVGITVDETFSLLGPDQQLLVDAAIRNPAQLVTLLAKFDVNLEVFNGLSPSAKGDVLMHLVAWGGEGESALTDIKKVALNAKAGSAVDLFKPAAPVRLVGAAPGLSVVPPASAASAAAALPPAPPVAPAPSVPPPVPAVRDREQAVFLLGKFDVNLEKFNALTPAAKRIVLAAVVGWEARSAFPSPEEKEQLIVALKTISPAADKLFAPRTPGTSIAVVLPPPPAPPGLAPAAPPGMTGPGTAPSPSSASAPVRPSVSHPERPIAPIPGGKVRDELIARLQAAVSGAAASATTGDTMNRRATGAPRSPPSRATTPGFTFFRSRGVGPAPASAEGPSGPAQVEVGVEPGSPGITPS